MEDSIQVIIRLQPPETDVIAKVSDRVLKIGTQQFKFDHIFSHCATQQEIFRKVGVKLITNTLKGYNSCIFVYGQTGSGKTFTMCGNNNGLMHQSFQFLEESLNEEASDFVMSCSYYQIYNEQVFDLLDLNNQSKKLNLREDIKKGVFIENLVEENADSADKLVSCLDKGIRNRHVGETQMNKQSSRSHALFTINISTKNIKDGVSSIRTSKLHFVDLAGSEKQKNTLATGERLKQANNINKSLSSLGLVINALSACDKGRTHIPYRDSKLTFLLKDSLGGNSKTFIVATLSSSPASFQDSLSTLKFVARAKLIKIKAEINEQCNGSMEALKEQIQKLKGQLSEALQYEKCDHTVKLQQLDVQYSELKNLMLSNNENINPNQIEKICQATKVFFEVKQRFTSELKSKIDTTNFKELSELKINELHQSKIDSIRLQFENNQLRSRIKELEEEISTLKITRERDAYYEIKKKQIVHKFLEQDLPDSYKILFQTQYRIMKDTLDTNKRLMQKNEDLKNQNNDCKAALYEKTLRINELEFNTDCQTDQIDVGQLIRRIEQLSNENLQLRQKNETNRKQSLKKQNLLSEARISMLESDNDTLNSTIRHIESELEKCQRESDQSISKLEAKVQELEKNSYVKDKIINTQNDYLYQYEAKENASRLQINTLREMLTERRDRQTKQIQRLNCNIRILSAKQKQSRECREARQKQVAELAHKNDKLEVQIAKLQNAVVTAHNQTESIRMQNTQLRKQIVAQNQHVLQLRDKLESVLAAKEIKERQIEQKIYELEEYEEEVKSLNQDRQHQRLKYADQKNRNQQYKQTLNSYKESVRKLNGQNKDLKQKHRLESDQIRRYYDSQINYYLHREQNLRSELEQYKDRQNMLISEVEGFKYANSNLTKELIMKMDQFEQLETSRNKSNQEHIRTKIQLIQLSNQCEGLRKSEHQYKAKNDKIIEDYFAVREQKEKLESRFSDLELLKNGLEEKYQRILNEKDSRINLMENCLDKKNEEIKQLELKVENLQIEYCQAIEIRQAYREIQRLNKQMVQKQISKFQQLRSNLMDEIELLREVKRQREEEIKSLKAELDKYEKKLEFRITNNDYIKIKACEQKNSYLSQISQQKQLQILKLKQKLIIKSYRSDKQKAQLKNMRLQTKIDQLFSRLKIPKSPQLNIQLINNMVIKENQQKEELLLQLINGTISIINRTRKDDKLSLECEIIHDYIEEHSSKTDIHLLIKEILEILGGNAKKKRRSI